MHSTFTQAFINSRNSLYSFNLKLVFLQLPLEEKGGSKNNISILKKPS